MDKSTEEKYTLLVLDGEENNIFLLPGFTSRASDIVCTDGAANRLYKYDILPSLVIGDLDSISPDVREYYRACGVRILHVAEQETNDFEKALRYLSDRENRPGDLRIIWIGGGRIDQTLSNLSILARYRNRFKNIVAYDGLYEIHIVTTEYPRLLIEGKQGRILSMIAAPHCIGITSEGLQYQMNNHELIFGQSESTSNAIANEQATVSIEQGTAIIMIESKAI